MQYRDRNAIVHRCQTSVRQRDENHIVNTSLNHTLHYRHTSPRHLHNVIHVEEPRQDSRDKDPKATSKPLHVPKSPPSTPHTHPSSSLKEIINYYTPTTCPPTTTYNHGYSKAMPAVPISNPDKKNNLESSPASAT